MCLPFLLSPVFLGVRAGSTMVLVWDLTIAIMNGSEREGRARERERQKGATGSSLHTTLSFFLFFFDVTFHKALCFQFIYLVKGLEGLTSCSVTSAGVKREVNSFSSHKLMLKADYKSS